MPAYSPKSSYELTSTQVDLILYCLEFTSNLTIDEDNERRRIVEQLNTFSPPEYIPSEDPYEAYCDI